jgi:hypothetical protein|nr:MAG TPA: hypothetical protein [Caudoviricetes sp.]
MLKQINAMLEKIENEQKNLKHPFKKTKNFTVKLSVEAQQYIYGTMKNGRPLDVKRMRRYANLMMMGGWDENLPTLRIDEHGHARGCQHTLKAGIESGTERWFLIVTGLPESAFNNDSSGKAWTKVQSVAQSTNFEIPKYHYTIMKKMLGYDEEMYFIPDHEVLALYRENENIIKYYDNLFHLYTQGAVSGKGEENLQEKSRRFPFSSTEIWAMMARAEKQGVPRQVMNNFINQYVTGTVKFGENQAAVVAYNQIMKFSTLGSGGPKTKMSNIIRHAIHNYVNNINDFPLKEVGVHYFDV